MPKVDKIKSFDRAECMRFSEAIEEELQKVGDKFGVAIKKERGSFTPNNFTLKIEASIIDNRGVVKSRDAETFKIYAKRYGLNPTDIGRSFKDWSGRTFTITGASSRLCRAPIFVDREDGKKFRFPSEEVKVLLER